MQNSRRTDEYRGASTLAGGPSPHWPPRRYGAASVTFIAVSWLLFLGCTATTSEDIVAYLRALPEDKLLLPLSMSMMVTLQPVIDGRCILGQVEELYADNKIAPVNYLMGLNSNEGGFMLFGMAALQSKLFSLY